MTSSIRVARQRRLGGVRRLIRVERVFGNARNESDHQLFAVNSSVAPDYEVAH